MWCFADGKLQLETIRGLKNKWMNRWNVGTVSKRRKKKKKKKANKDRWMDG